MLSPQDEARIDSLADAIWDIAQDADPSTALSALVFVAAHVVFMTAKTANVEPACEEFKQHLLECAEFLVANQPPPTPTVQHQTKGEKR